MTFGGDIVKKNNICKFTNYTFVEPLLISNFVLETNEETMRKGTVLSQNIVILVTAGKGNFSFNNKQHNYAIGNLFFGFEGEVFSALPSSETKYIYISFSGVRAEMLFKRFGITANNRFFSDFDGIIPIWSESLSRATEDTIDIAVESMLLYAFSRLSGKANTQNSIIDKMIRISEENFSDSTLSLTTISEKLNYNSKYLSHLFKTNMGVTYSEYLKDLRIKYAISLFSHGIESVKNIAYLSGFSDPLYFSTVFKNIIGISPKEYKNKIKTNKED